MDNDSKEAITFWARNQFWMITMQFRAVRFLPKSLTHWNLLVDTTDHPPVKEMPKFGLEAMSPGPRRSQIWGSSGGAPKFPGFFSLKPV